MISSGGRGGQRDSALYFRYGGGGNKMPLTVNYLNREVCTRAGIEKIKSSDTYAQACVKFDAWLDAVPSVYTRLCEWRVPQYVRRLVEQNMLRWLLQVVSKYMPDVHMSLIEFTDFMLGSTLVVKAVGVLGHQCGSTVLQVAGFLERVEQLALVIYFTVIMSDEGRSRSGTPAAGAVGALLLC